MPQPPQTFVSLSQLDIIDEYEVPTNAFSGETFSPVSFDLHPQHTSEAKSWAMAGPPMLSDMVQAMSPYAGSSGSNSPISHENFSSVTQEQHQKRRAQNRAA
jgi:hypothetical protein